jgi:uncharacterized membrane protein SpoIIM required for sporulation
MTEDKFILKHEEKWKHLEHYNNLLRKRSISTLETTQINQFAELFRECCLHLAYAKTHYPEGGCVPYLNQLAGIAHQHFYLRRKTGVSSVTHYILKGFPEAIQDKRVYVYFAFALFLFSFFIGSLMLLFNLEHAYMFFSENYVQYLRNNIHDSETALENINHSLFGAQIMTNNILVTFNAIAGGVLAGLGTVFIMVLNGLFLGALAALFSLTGQSMLGFYSLILPHGFIELAAIFICGGCGLLIGKSLLMPGDLSRKDSLIKGAKEAAYFLPGIIIMLVIGALIEGFFTPLPIDPWIKLIFSFLSLALMLIYYRRALR